MNISLRSIVHLRIICPWDMNDFVAFHASEYVDAGLSGHRSGDDYDEIYASMHGDVWTWYRDVPILMSHHGDEDCHLPGMETL